MVEILLVFLALHYNNDMLHEFTVRPETHEYQLSLTDDLKLNVWVAGKTVWSPCYTRAISERFRDKQLIIKHNINSPSLLLL